MDFDLKQFFLFITRLKTSSIFRNLKVDAYPFNFFLGRVWKIHARLHARQGDDVVALH